MLVDDETAKMPSVNNDGHHSRDVLADSMMIER